MKIHLRTLPISRRVRGWKRLVRWVTHALHATLVVEVGRSPFNPAS